MKRIYFIILIFLYVKCSNKIEFKIINSIEKNCKSTIDCQINLREIIPFKWDSIYIFGEITSTDEISTALGFAYEGTTVQEGDKRIVFISGQKIVYEEDFNFKSNDKSTIGFVPLKANIDAQKTFITFSAKDAIFNIKKEARENKNYFYYSLNPIRNFQNK
jgi:hypothetical protein